MIDARLYLGTLVDLPGLIEAQKTLDFRTFYKSVDVAQMLYIHNKSIDIQDKTPQQLKEFAREFNPVKDDPEFLQNLYRKGETAKKVEEFVQLRDVEKQETTMENFKFRHGLAPVAKNVRNIRFKKEYLLSLTL